MSSKLKKNVQRACKFIKRCKEQNFCNDEFDLEKTDPRFATELVDMICEMNEYSEKGHATQTLL